MSYAIIRNQKYKRCNLGLAYRHNERINRSYSNKEIDKQRTELNYHLKKPENSYEKAFENIKSTIKSFISWVCKKFSVQSEDEMIHEFANETGIDLNLEKQINVKQAEKESFELEV